MNSAELFPIYPYPEKEGILLDKLLGPQDPHGRRLAYTSQNQNIEKEVASIITRVLQEGDQALIAYSKTFDQVHFLDAKAIRLSAEEQALFQTMRADPKVIAPELLTAIEVAATNIRNFHQAQKLSSLTHTGRYGETLTLAVKPIETVGFYVPGGTSGQTPLLSTLLMNVIPAQIAGVCRIVVVSPPRPDGSLAPALMAALDHLGITEVYKIGGAHAIAALAYGTKSIPSVHFISGPGNAYVTAAKRQVFGQVGIEALSGHSEIVIFADTTSNPRHAALDLLSQAEHAGGEMAVLITPSIQYAQEFLTAIQEILPTLSRRKLIEKSLSTRGAIVIADIANAPKIINELAPEHLELLIRDPEKLLPEISHAGAIFLGAWSSEPIGDYIAGTNHILPTGSTARFSSPLSVRHFLRSSNIIKYNHDAFHAYAKHAVVLAEAEMLTAHARALTERLNASRPQ